MQKEQSEIALLTTYYLESDLIFYANENGVCVGVKERNKSSRHF